MLCKVCGKEYFSQSFGGPDICAACDCGINPALHDEIGLRMKYEIALQAIRRLPTYSVSQGICIDGSPDKLLKVEEVYRIIDCALGSPVEAQGK